MTLSDVLVSAIVAALVSLVTALVSYFAQRRALAIEREKFEKQLQRTLTEKLYDLRLASYPKALEITEALRRSRLWSEETTLKEAYLLGVLNELDAWHSTKAAFLLSSNGMEALYELRRALRDKPQPDGTYTQQQVERIWQAKGRFRQALRSDIILLYSEEIEPARPGV
jgi:hypothetical protein